MRAGLLLSLFGIGGCLYSPSKGPPRNAADDKALVKPASADSPLPHSQRLGWVHWQNSNTLEACNRRLDDNGNPIGVLGPCFTMSTGDAGPKKMLDWLNGSQPDDTPLSHTPDPRCTIEIKDAELVPHATAARTWLVAPAGRTLLAEWTPAQEQIADLFVMEPSYSPDGKTLALLRLGIGLGEGERSVEVAGITMTPAPFCRHY